MGHNYLIVSGPPCIPDECLEGFRICIGRGVEGLPFILPDSALTS